ncbi:GAF domain-containing protein [Radiobacillus kanasensis]|uniref:GAF domain-containing protein n=1 Tax=Radiobacillus kanasensis TaxID=2844358 RepID=UPI001E5852B5|nr:GAF domain-containing protein [Radiobacillus kanasensis]UFT98800.1 GAF domain-containing protein [Radiobacillus kanasensis]
MSNNLKKYLSYFFSFLVTVILLFSLGSIFKTIIKSVISWDISLLEAVLYLGACYGVAASTVVYARYLRSNSYQIPFAGINLPNWFYDEDFRDGGIVTNKKLIKDYKELKERNEELELLIEGIMEELDRKTEDLNFESYISDIYIRHHKNSSRLVRSLLQLINEGKSNWKWEFYNNVLDECNTVLLKDHADKSSSIYFINQDNELEMYVYNRIEFSSSRKRRFKKNEGFAGHVWSYGKTLLINDITESEFFTEGFAPKHGYESILGVPIKIGEEIVGVLNIQSENKDGFNHEDERSVKFYADMCALAYYYDKIKLDSEGRGINHEKF